MTVNTSRSPIISGPELVCSSGASFTVNNPVGTTISWNQSANLSRTSPQGSNPCIFTATGSGEGWIEATVTTGCGDITLPRHEVYTGELPTPTISGNYVIKCGSRLTYRVDDINRVNGESFYWESDILSIANETSPTCTVWGTFDGFGYISSTVTACGISKTRIRNDIGVIWCDFLLLSPNPSTSETTVSIESTSEESPDMNTEWDLEVYDQSQLLKIKKTKLRGRDYRLNTSGWKEGVYIVRVSYNSELLTGKLVVKEQ